MSCCTCGCSPCTCGCGSNPTVCCTPTTESVAYTFENSGLIGVGVLEGETDNLVQFRSIASDTLALTVTLDAPNQAIIISFNDELLIDDIPTFTETVRGIGEAATQAETNAGVVDNVIVTPLKLNDRTATETRTGIAEIATQAEVNTGTDDTRIVTPLKLATFAANSNTRVFADAVARAAATPSFNGQIGIQLDTDAFITATGTSPGDFSANFVVDGTLKLGSNGTSPTPVITWTSDQDTGIFHSSDLIGLTAGGSTRLQITGSEIECSVNVFITTGAANAPAIAFIANVDTGLYLAGASDELGFSTNAASRMILSDSALSLETGVSLEVDNTISGGTGDVIINKIAGTANIAAAATGLTVTNSFVTSNSIILCQIASNDSTLKTLAITQTAGSFTLVGNAAANATTRVNWLVINKT